MIDFGIAKSLEGEDGNGLINTRCGTPGYQAPEILVHQSCSGKAADLFALGVSLFVMHTKRRPFREATDSDKKYRYFCTKPEKFWKIF